MDTLAMYLLAAAFFGFSAWKDPRKTRQAFVKGLKAIEGILPQLLAVLLVIALVLAVFEPATISRVLGERTGFLGVLFAGIIGAITLIPGFVAFPATGELLRHGAGTLQAATFVSSLMMVGVVTLPVEIACFGRRAALARNGLAFLFSFGAAYFVAWVVGL